MKDLVSASLLGCDLADLKNEIKSIESAGADWLHCDVMDGVFVNNISFGTPVLKCVRKVASVPMDTHLMITDPIRYIDDYADLGSDNITFHLEAASDPRAVITKIHSRGKSAGISIKPATPVSVVKPYLDVVDMVLVMTVEPGFGGQKFVADTLEKISEIRYLLDSIGRPEVNIEVDGGVNGETVKLCREAGANVFVSGTYIFGAEDRKAAVNSLKV
jgi:ribulose-phosphate 3-epimerase